MSDPDIVLEEELEFPASLVERFGDAQEFWDAYARTYDTTQGADWPSADQQHATSTVTRPDGTQYDWSMQWPAIHDYEAARHPKALSMTAEDAGTLYASVNAGMNLAFTKWDMLSDGKIPDNPHLRANYAKAAILGLYALESAFDMDIMADPLISTRFQSGLADESLRDRMDKNHLDELITGNTFLDAAYQTANRKMGVELPRVK